MCLNAGVSCGLLMAGPARADFELGLLRETEQEWERQELRAEEAEAALEEEREEARYWRAYAEKIEGKLLRALDRLQEYDQAYITKLEEKLEELEAQE